MKFERLAPVRDSIALSDRNSAVFFDVARDGEVTVFSEYCFQTHTKEVLCKFDVSGMRFRWRGGWLPILMIGDDIELFASGDELFIRNCSQYTVYPGGRESTADEFEEKAGEISRYWTKWFADGRQFPSTGSFLDDAWKSSLVQALCTFSGRHPHYGAHYYRNLDHDGFPPNVLSMTETLMQFGHPQEALEIFLYYFKRFVDRTGLIRYYGPSLAEYGGLMWIGAKIMEQMPDHALQIAETLHELICRILTLFNPVINQDQDYSSYTLLAGSPEADERMKIEVYFHNNFQLLRGFEMLVPELKKIGWHEFAGELNVYAGLLKRMLSKALDDKKREIGGVPYSLSQKELIADFQSTRENRFANYRYYLEMLESGYLSRADALTVIGYREHRNGEYHSLTHFTRSTGVKECDNWPVASYARALLEYGEKDRFMRLFRSHLFNYISDDTFTAYEQVANEGDPRLSQMPGCVPVQLVLPRLFAWSWYYKKWDGAEVRWNGPDFPL